MTPQKIIEAVRDAQAAGIAIVPPRQDGSKAPLTFWTAYQEKKPTQWQIDRWYEEKKTGIGWVTGRVSGNLEVIDFDNRSTWDEYQGRAKEWGLDDLLTRVRLGYLERSPNGVHLAYRCDTIAGNQKLASRSVPEDSKVKTLVETRGEGGYLIVAPTYGGVNPDGVYETVSGSPRTIVTITPEERQQLLDLARSLDELPPKEEWQPKHTSSLDGRPGDDYDSKTSWEEILAPHGWVCLGRRGGQTHWRRPGKKIGTSATTGGDKNWLHVFSTSTEFEAGRGYSKFSAYALLNHGGNYSDAAKELALLGFGSTPDISGVDISQIKPPTPKKDTGLGDLLNVGGAVGELADWINRTSRSPQPVLALGASLAAMATVVGRKVMTTTGLRSNIYALGIAESGAGKERAREAIRDLFFAALCQDRARVDDLASDAAIVTEVHRSPSCLFLLDEIGLFLKAVSDDRAPAHLRAINSVLLRLYSQTSGVFYGKSYADADRNLVIEQPCLSIYGTSVPTAFYGALSSASISDGFLSRCMVFVSADPDPLPQTVPLDQLTPPDGLVSHFAAWEAAPLNDPKGNLDQTPRPQVVPETGRARAAFADLEADMRDKRAKLRKQGLDPALYTRTVATAAKLALVRACGFGVGAVEIDGQGAEWACSLATYLSDLLWDQARDHIADSREGRASKIILRALKRARKPLTLTQLARQTQQLTRRERWDAINDLAEKEHIAVNKSAPDGRGRPQTHFAFLGD